MWYHYDDDEFQSLIGRLGTTMYGGAAMIIVMFQSLIGRLGTVVTVVFSEPTLEFQSLIGRLGTNQPVD